MKFNFKYKANNPEPKLEVITRQEPVKLKVKDMFKIDDDVEEVIDTLNVFDLCKVPFFYGCEKKEMLEWLQPHSTDVAIISLDKDWREDFYILSNVLQHRATIYAIDTYSIHNHRVESAMHGKGFKASGELKLNGLNVFEYTRNGGESYASAFNVNYTYDIFSILFINLLDFDTIVYCDIEELISLLFHAENHDKPIFMPLKLNTVEWVEEVLNKKKSEAQQLIMDKKLQFKLF